MDHEICSETTKNLGAFVKGSENIQVYIYNHDGTRNSFSVSLEDSVKNVKDKAVSTLFTMKNICNQKFRLLCAKNYKNLLDENSLREENVSNNDTLLLIECRNGNLRPGVQSNLNYITPFEEEVEVTPKMIDLQTRYISSVNMERQPEASRPLEVDFKIALRRILLTLIEVSARLISVEENAVNIFTYVFTQLERKQMSKLDKAALKQLTDMGFTERRAANALILKRDPTVAMEWLLEELNIDNSTAEETDILDMTANEAKNYFLSGTDPAINVLKEFKKYVYKWFQPDLKALEILQDLGYGADVSLEALRTTFNNEQIALQLLEGDNIIALEMNEGYPRDLPIMSALMASHSVQLSLGKQKILYALMTICENPVSASIWLSDVDTHPCVSQILRIYHSEKYRLLSVTKGKRDSSESNPSGLTSFNLHERAENSCTNSPSIFMSRTPPALQLSQAITSPRSRRSPLPISIRRNSQYDDDDDMEEDE